MSAVVEQLEREFASWLGKSGAVAAGFGRGALLLALEAAEVRGADVLVPNFICAQVPEAARRAGGNPVFYAVGRDLRIDPNIFCSAFTPQTRAAVVPHYFGRVQPHIEQLVAICRGRGVLLVEDCALALGARLNGRLAGTFGDVAVFSFTKSDWSYGGGMVACNSPELRQQMCDIRAEKFRPAGWLAFCYGLLRCADFTANRPARATLAEFSGRKLERLLSWFGAFGSTGVATVNFYDAGRFDTLLPDFTAGRARRILDRLLLATERRRAQCSRFAEVAPGLVCDPGDACSFLLVTSALGRAEDWLQQAAACGVTLRLSWPAYQRLNEGQGTDDLLWLARHLLILELHPDASPGEVQRIAGVLREMGSRAD